jgi:hypothetical protein
MMDQHRRQHILGRRRNLPPAAKGGSSFFWLEETHDTHESILQINQK